MKPLKHLKPLKLSKVYLRIITNIQRPRFPFNFRITANEWIIEHHVVDFGKWSNDRILYNGVLNNSIFAQGYIRADNGVANVTTFGNAYRWNNDRIFKCMQLRNSPPEFLNKIALDWSKDSFLPQSNQLETLKGLNSAPLWIMHSSASVRLNSL